jgi:hypothetical protein
MTVCHDIHDDTFMPVIEIGQVVLKIEEMIVDVSGGMQHTQKFVTTGELVMCRWNLCDGFLLYRSGMFDRLKLVNINSLIRCVKTIP